MGSPTQRGWRQPRSTALAFAAAALIVLIDERSARAWPHAGEMLHPGLIYRHISGTIEIPGTGVTWQSLHILYIDGDNGELSFVGTRRSERGLSLTDFADRVGVAAAINANYFDRGRASCGLMVSEGQAWSDAYHHLPFGRCSDSVGFDRVNGATFFDSWDLLTGPPPAGITTVVTGMPRLLRDGAVTSAEAMRDSAYPRNLRSPNPRTAICTHEDGRTVLFVVVEGRAPGRRGMTGHELARFLGESLGCRDAIALDGGGSSHLFLRGQAGANPDGPPGLVTRAGPRGERGLCCHLGVRVTPGAAMWRAQWVDQSPALRVVAGRTFSLWVRLRNVGRRTWRPAGQWPVVLESTLDSEFPNPLFLESEWLSPTSPGVVDGVVPPGEVGLFLLRGRAPDQPGDQIVTFQPAVNGSEVVVMDSPILRWTIHVEPDNELRPHRSSHTPR